MCTSFCRRASQPDETAAMCDDRVPLLEQVGAVRAQLRILDRLLHDVTERVHALPGGRESATSLTLLGEQHVLARQMTATLREQQDLLSRYLEPLRQHLGARGVA